MAAGTPNPSVVNHVVSVLGRNEGLRYFELVYENAPASSSDGIRVHFGLTTDNPPATNVDTGGSTNGIAWRSFGSIVSPTSFYAFGSEAPEVSTGTIICAAVNFTSLKFWMGRVIAGVPTWVRGGDPAAGTGQTGSFTAGTYYITSCCGGLATPFTFSVRIRTGASQFSGPIPAGFIAWAAG